MSEQEQPEAPKAFAPPRSFPVPRNRPILVDPAELAAATRGRRLRRALAFLTVTLVAGFSWYFTRPPQEQAIRPAPVATITQRVPGDDPAVEIYFQPSEPEILPPLEEDRTPLPVAPVSLDDIFGKE